MEDENLCLLKLANVGPGILLMSNDSEQIVQAVTHVKTRWQLSQPVSLCSIDFCSFSFVCICGYLAFAVPLGVKKT